MQSVKKKPVVFISYAWVDDAHKRWVKNLADGITHHQVPEIPRIKVGYDQEKGFAGHDLFGRMQALVAQATVILIVLTPNYKERADGNYGAVGYEYGFIQDEMLKKPKDRKAIIPILKNGSFDDSTPRDLRRWVGIDMSTPEKFKDAFLDLLKSIVNPEALNDPIIWESPNFYKGVGPAPNYSRGHTTTLFNNESGMFLVIPAGVIFRSQDPEPDGHHDKRHDDATDEENEHHESRHDKPNPAEPDHADPDARHTQQHDGLHGGHDGLHGGHQQIHESPPPEDPQYASAWHAGLNEDLRHDWHYPGITDQSQVDDWHHPLNKAHPLFDEPHPYGTSTGEFNEPYSDPFFQDDYDDGFSSGADDLDSSGLWDWLRNIF